MGDTQLEQEGAAGRQQATSDRASVPTYTPLQSPSHPPNATQPGHAARDAPTEEPRATPQRPPLPMVGVARPWTARLISDLSQPSHSTFLSWCRRQFIIANYGTLEECEPLAEAVYAFSQRVLSDHDWENESDMPPLPMNSDDFYDFSLGSGHGRMWGNLRRLFNIRVNASWSFLEYYLRNLAKDKFYVERADSIARDIIRLVREKGLSRDWNAENDVELHKPSVETTKNLRLEDLNGHWNVSALMSSWQIFRSFRLTPTQVRAIIGRGGNGRALLYCKYDSAGNILQVSLH